MLVECGIKCRVKYGKYDWFEIETQDTRVYESYKGFQQQKSLCIWSISPDGEKWETLKEIPLDNPKGLVMIYFHSVSYAYDVAKDAIYCLNLRQDI